MPPAPLVVPALLLAVTLVVSGRAKVRRPRETADAFVSLGLPPRLAQSAAPRLLPWGEIGLALALVLAPGRAYAVAALLTLLLLLAYLGLIARALRSTEPVRCACFGDLGLGEVTRRTLWRNALLVLLGAVALWDAAAGRGIVERLVGFASTEWAWLGTVAVGGLLTWLVVGGPSGGRMGDGRATAGPAEKGADEKGADEKGADEEDLDYHRLPIPYGVLHAPDGSPTTLRSLAATRARVLVFLSLGCGGCLRALAALPQWAASVPILAVHPVLSHEMEAADPRVAGLDPLIDHAGQAGHTFGLGTPAAVVLGADGLLAGGPVAGFTAIEDLFTALAEQLSAAD